MSVYTKQVLVESAAQHTNASINPIQAAIDIAAIDHTLFESLIELDFAQVWNESGVIMLTEEENKQANEAQKKGIIEGIKRVIGKAIAAIKNFLGSIKEFFEKLFKHDKVNGEAFKNLTYEDITECPAKGEYFSITGYSKFINETVKNATAHCIDPENERLKEDYEKIMSHTKEVIKEFVKDSGEETIAKCITASDWDRMVADVWNGEYKFVRSFEPIIEKQLAQLKAKEAQAMSKAGDDAETGKAEYDKIVDGIRDLNKLLTSIGSIAKKATKVERANVVKLARFGYKNSEKDEEDKKETAATESAEYYDLIDVLNENFVDNLFEA